MKFGPHWRPTPIANQQSPSLAIDKLKKTPLMSDSSTGSSHSGLGSSSQSTEEEKKVDTNQAELKCADVVDLAPINMAFRKLSENSIWQAKEGAVYDDHGSGPANLPENVHHLNPLQIFTLLFPLSLAKAIVAQTNLYYSQRCVALGKEVKRKELATVREFYTWMGLHMRMTRNWPGAQDLFWVKGKTSFDARNYMTRRRFYWIKAHLHFRDKSQRPTRSSPDFDHLFLLRPLVTTFNATFRKYWKLCSYVSLDEMMMHFRGHNPYHRHIPRKPHPNGFKLHAICDAKQYFCVAFLLDDNVKRTIPQIAQELFRDTVKPGMTVITDRFYTCTALVQYCLSLDVGLIGSTKATRFLGKHVLTGWSGNAGKNIPRGHYEVATNHGQGVACVCWKDKGVVRLTTTCFSTARIHLVRREKRMRPFKVKAPYIAELFDHYFHGVDRNDQLRGKGYGISLTFKAQKYTVKFFLGMLDVILSNTWILWRTLHPRERKRHGDWYERLFFLLLSHNPLDDPEFERQEFNPDEVVTINQLHTLVPFKKNPKTKKRYKSDCPVCSLSAKRVRTSWGCVSCMVGLCNSEARGCSRRWHFMSPMERGKLKNRRPSLHFDHHSDEYLTGYAIASSTASDSHQTNKN